MADPWLILGFFGQAFFFSRFVVQWIVAERRGESVVPTSFWYLSIGGGLILLLYAIHKWDYVFMVGQATGTFVYARNLMLIHRKKAGGLAA